MIACPDISSSPIAGIYVWMNTLSPHKSLQNLVKTTITRIKTEETNSEAILPKSM